MTPIWTIDLTPSEIIEGSSFHILSERWKKAGSHDDVNTIFVDYIPDDATAMKVYEMTNEDGDQLTGDALFAVVGSSMFDEDQPIQLYKWQAEELFRRTEYKLFCGKYATKDDLNADYTAVFGESADLSKTLEDLVIETRAKLKIILAGG